MSQLLFPLLNLSIKQEQMNQHAIHKTKTIFFRKKFEYSIYARALLHQARGLDSQQLLKQEIT
jgi:hypothetical protein